MTGELKPVRCGCGGEAKVRDYSRFGGAFILVECERCGISRTTALYTKVANKFTDVEEAMKLAREIWDSRVEPVKNRYIAVELDGLKSKTVG